MDISRCILLQIFSHEKHRAGLRQRSNIKILRLKGRLDSDAAIKKEQLLRIILSVFFLGGSSTGEETQIFSSHRVYDSLACLDN